MQRKTLWYIRDTYANNVQSHTLMACGLHYCFVIKMKVTRKVKSLNNLRALLMVPLSVMLDKLSSMHLVTESKRLVE